MIGILFAFGALLCWGIGDFLIQRSARKFGDWIALLYIAAIGLILFTPFAIRELEILADLRITLMLLGGSVLMLIVALIDFEALKRGKMSVIEPIFTTELIVTAILANFISRERLSLAQTSLIAVLLVGMVMLSTRNLGWFKRIRLERGVWLAVVATIGMGFVNYAVLAVARESSPVMINWMLCVVITPVIAIYLSITRRWGEVLRGWKHHRKLIIAVGIFDNAAWLFYAASALYIPMAIATGISESYVALAAALGLRFNHEKLKRHQWVGLVVAVIAAIALAVVTE